MDFTYGLRCGAYRDYQIYTQKRTSWFDGIIFEHTFPNEFLYFDCVKETNRLNDIYLDILR